MVEVNGEGCECYDEEVQPYRKTDYKPIIYIYINILDLPCIINEQILEGTDNR